MYEIVDEKDLTRFAIITWEDLIFYDSNDVLDVQEFFRALGGHEVFKGIYDYEQCMYLDEADIVDIVGAQTHSQD